MNDITDWVRVFTTNTEHGWLPHQDPPAPDYKFRSRTWRIVRSVVEKYLGPNLYVSTALAAVGGIRSKFFAKSKE